MNLKEIKKVDKKVDEIMRLAWQFKQNKLTEKDLKDIIEGIVKTNLIKNENIKSKRK